MKWSFTHAIFLMAAMAAGHSPPHPNKGSPSELSRDMAMACMKSPECSARYVTTGAGGTVRPDALAKDFDAILESHGLTHETKEKLHGEMLSDQALAGLALDLKLFCVRPEECIDRRALQYYMPGVLASVAVAMVMFGMIFYIELTRAKM
jgi:hypothetical protein